MQKKSGEGLPLSHSSTWSDAKIRWEYGKKLSTQWM